MAIQDVINRLCDLGWLMFIPGITLFMILVGSLPFIWVMLIANVIGLVTLIAYWIISKISIGGLDKRAVFITGCDTGFGNRLALKCLKEGMPVFAGCLTQDGANRLKMASENHKGKLECIVVDVSSDESVRKAAEFLDKETVKYGGLHALVNNAGIAGNCFFDDFLTVDDYKNILDVNTLGPIRVTQAMKHLVKKTKGRIVTVTSMAARTGMVGTGPYSVSKHATMGYCEAIRSELRLFGVSIHQIEPGLYRTFLSSKDNIENSHKEIFARASAELKAEYGSEFISKCNRRLHQFFQYTSSPRIDSVVDAYFHAMTSAFPKLRYNVGLDTSLMYLPLAYMPSGLKDVFVAMALKVGGLPTPAAMKK